MSEPVMPQKTPYTVELEEGKSYWWCSCGLSANQPFCDGAHKKEAKFKPVLWTAEETGTKVLCGCKHTKNSPFCDGSHAKI